MKETLPTQFTFLFFVCLFDRNINERDIDWNKILDRFDKVDPHGALLFLLHDVKANSKKSRRVIYFFFEFIVDSYFNK
jgi:hypothetical protein